MIEIQTQMSERAVELLNLPEGQPCFLLDVGWVSHTDHVYCSSFKCSSFTKLQQHDRKMEFEVGCLLCWKCWKYCYSLAVFENHLIWMSPVWHMRHSSLRFDTAHCKVQNNAVILCVCGVKDSGDCLSLRCGSGLSGDYLSEEGHYWVGVDISTAMLG